MPTLPGMQRTRRWYNRIGIEEPFPLLPIVAVSVPVSICLSAVLLGIVMF